MLKVEDEPIHNMGRGIGRTFREVRERSVIGGRSGSEEEGKATLRAFPLAHEL